jgi:dihydroxyacetone kinase-like protein
MDGEENMGKSKKIINDPQDVVTELLDGLVRASHGTLAKLPDVTAIVRNPLPANKVGLLVGGGSGHEPLFAGFVGHNLADGAACGHIFAAPSPDIVLAATMALDSGFGVLYLYGNYAGDNLNFDIATELADEAGVKTRTVRVWDDVASAAPGNENERRGIAGDFFVIKIAGGVAATSKDLDNVYRVTSRARDSVRSMGVAVSAGSLPETGERTFELPDGEIEIGMGLHGEAGVSREMLLKADPLVERMMAQILSDLPFVAGDQVCLLINNLGATTMMELLIVSRRTHQILVESDIRVHDTVVGSFCTSQEMAGFSISLLKLDEELKLYYNMPAKSFAFTKA